jgi:hypothetical protein
VSRRAAYASARRSGCSSSRSCWCTSRSRSSEQPASSTAGSATSPPIGPLRHRREPLAAHRAAPSRLDGSRLGLRDGRALAFACRVVVADPGGRATALRWGLVLSTIPMVVSVTSFRWRSMTAGGGCGDGFTRRFPLRGSSWPSPTSLRDGRHEPTAAPLALGYNSSRHGVSSTTTPELEGVRQRRHRPLPVRRRAELAAGYRSRCGPNTEFLEAAFGLGYRPAPFAVRNPVEAYFDTESFDILRAGFTLCLRGSEPGSK